MESKMDKFHTLGPEGSFHQLALEHHRGNVDIQLHDNFEQIFASTKTEGKGWIAVRNSIAGLVENNQLIIDQSFNKIKWLRLMEECFLIILQSLFNLI